MSLMGSDIHEVAQNPVDAEQQSSSQPTTEVAESPLARPSSEPAVSSGSSSKRQNTRANTRYGRRQKPVRQTAAKPKIISVSSDSKSTLNTLRRMEQEERTLQRQLESTLYRRHHVYSDLGIEQMYIHLQHQAQQQKEEKIHLSAMLSAAKQQVKALVALLENVSGDANYLSKVQDIMTKAETAIADIKASQRDTYNQLLRDETALSRELQLLEQSFDRWQARPLKAQSKSSVAKRTGSKVAALQQPSADLPPEVTAYETYLIQNGGREGGWEVYDHGTYLRHLKKHGQGNVELIAQHVATALLGKSEDDVRQHHAWYVELLRLDEVKRAAVERWRQEKAEEEVRRREAIAKEEQATMAAEAAARRRTEEQRRKRRQAQAAKVEAWQVSKQQTEEEEQRQKAEAERRRREAIARQKMAREAEVKAEVASYAKAKEQERQQKAELARALKQQERLEAKQLAERIANRNKQSIRQLQQRKQQQQQQAAAEQQAKTDKLDRLRDKVRGQVRAERDPTRLTSLNAAARHRLADKTKPSGRMVVRAPPKLHVPSWRQGL